MKIKSKPQEERFSILLSRYPSRARTADYLIINNNY